MAPHPPSEDPAALLLARLRQAGWYLGVAESLTGGLLADRFVRVPGASQVFRGGLLTYATELKEDLLGVDGTVLATHGPVHPDVAAQMAIGAASSLGAEVTLATTGAAGPAGQDGQDVGTLYLACAHPSGVWVRHYRLAGSREHLRSAAVGLALSLGLATVDAVVQRTPGPRAGPVGNNQGASWR